MSGYKDTTARAEKSGFSPTGGGPSAVQTCALALLPAPVEPCYIPRLQLDAVTFAPKMVEVNPANIGNISGAHMPRGEEQKNAQTVTYVHGTTAGLPASVRGLLGSDDLLLQIAVSGTDTGAASSNRKKPGSLKVTAGHAPSCAAAEHPANTIYDASAPDLKSEFGTAPEMFQVVATPPPDLVSLADGREAAQRALSAGVRSGMGLSKAVGTALVIGAAASVQRGLWARISPFSDKSFRTYRVEAPSCGIPSTPGDIAPAKVTARVEVYRQRSVKLIIKLPSLDSAKSGTSLMKNLKTGERVAEYKQERQRIRADGIDKYEAGAEAKVNASRTQAEVTASGVMSFDPQATKALWQTSVTLVIDGTKIDSHVLGNLLALPFKVYALFTDIKDVVPKWGFTWDVDMSFATGSFEVETKIGPSSKALHDRVWLVERYEVYKISGELLSVTGAFGVGFDVKVEAKRMKLNIASFVLKVEVGASLSAKLDLTFDSRSGKPAQINFECPTELFGKAVAEATVLGYGVKAVTKLSGGFKFDLEAKLDRSADKKLDGKMSWLGVKLDVQVTILMWSLHDKTYPFGAPREMWRGAIIGASDTSEDAAAVSATAGAGSA